MKYTIDIAWDEEANVWVGTSEEIPGLVLEEESCDRAVEKVRIAVSELITLNGLSEAEELYFRLKTF